MACSCAPHNKQLQRTVGHKVPSHLRQRAAAELRRYAARAAYRIGRSMPPFKPERL
jgi:hypothetical protein